MMGKKKLSNIQADVAEEFAKQGIDPEEWFTARIGQLQAKKQPDKHEVEALKLLRSAIASAANKEKLVAQKEDRVDGSV